MTFDPSWGVNLFLLPYFPYIAIAMIGYAIFCSYKQYHLNADLSIEEVNDTYGEKGALRPLGVSLILVYFIGLDVATYEAGFQYSKEFLNGEASVSFLTMLDVTMGEYVRAAGWVLCFMMFGICAYAIMWLLFLLCAHPKSDDYDVRRWDLVQKHIVPNPKFSRYYVLDERNAIAPFLVSLALVLTLSGYYVYALGEKEEHKFYTTDVQLNQPVLNALQDNCEHGSAQYRNGVLTCDSRTLHSIFMPSGHIYDVVVVWGDNNSSKHEVLIRIPARKAPPVKTPEEATQRVLQILDSVNEPFMESQVTSENRAAWEKLER